jgi:hypothetical protein
MITLKNFDPTGFTVNDKPATKESKGCMSFFFLLHYGGFHLAYFFFLLIGHFKGAELRYIGLGALTFFLESLITFRRKKIAEETKTINIGTLFFLPYLRIIPMHLTILLPSFFHWQPSMLFLLLKTGADVLFYLFTRRMYEKSVIA